MFLIFFSGLQKWSQGDKRMKKHENFVTTLTKAYNNYKTKYVKRISFNPEEKSLMSKYTFTSYKKFFFFQAQPWIMPRWRQCTSTLTRQPMMRLRGMKR